MSKSVTRVPSSNLGKNFKMLCICQSNLRFSNFHKSSANLKDSESDLISRVMVMRIWQSTLQTAADILLAVNQSA